MKVVLIDRASPVSERLVREISELSDVQIEIQDPCDPGVDKTVVQHRGDRKLEFHSIPNELP